MIIVRKGGPGSGNKGHKGRPGFVGGSGEGTGTSTEDNPAPPSSSTTPIGAKPLSYYMDIINSVPLTENPPIYGSNHVWSSRKIPYEWKDYSVLQGLENESRNCERNYNMKFDEYVTKVEDEFQKQLADSDVFMRITPENLEEALKDGTFENTFSAKDTGAALRENKLSYKTYIKHRLDGEREALGVATHAAPEDRPIYGFWSKDDKITNNEDVFLEQYGSITVKFDKDAIQDSLTFTDVDSLDFSSRVRSSDWRHPSILSSFGITNSTYLISVAHEGPDAGGFWEAQIYNHSVSNISKIMSRRPLPKSLTDLLDERGIQWEIQ